MIESSVGVEGSAQEIYSKVSGLYSTSLAKFGSTPQGVQWNGVESQSIRFKQLCRIISSANPYSINDLGCGYGALVDYLQEHHPDFDYHGCDVCGNMIHAAKVRFDQHANVDFVVGSVPPVVADYCVASGIFNLRLVGSDAEWRKHLDATLDVMNATSRLGFAFNCLTTYSDADKVRHDHYYADPCVMFDYCKRKYSRNVALLHDYEIYDFTILVRK